MAGPSLFSFFSSFISGLRLIDGGDLQNLAAFTLGAQSGLVALAGGGATGATTLRPAINEIKTVGTTGDSCLLPTAIAGLTVRVINDGANTAYVYPVQANPGNPSNAGDQITLHNATAPQAAGVYGPVATQNVSDFICFTNGVWKQTVLT